MALEDITAHRGGTDPIEGLIRIETSPREQATPVITEMIRRGSVDSGVTAARSNTACGRPSPMFQPAGGWCTAKRTALRVWTTSNRTGPIYGRRVCARGWQRARGFDM
jgi:hypothetical protein